MAATSFHYYWFVLSIAIISPILAHGNENFAEELFIKPLKSGHVMFHFRFTTIWDESLTKKPSSQHYRLFPKAIGEVVSTYGIQEMHLSQTQGLWHYQKWGYPPEDAPPGAELWVWFQESAQNLDTSWSHLVNSLSGIFCSSLNFMDAKVTVKPRWTFRPEGVASPRYSANSSLLRYAALPRELVCTENLTPWKKLLPCDSKVGLSTLFNAVKLYDSTYNSIGFHLRPVCRGDNCQNPALELKQTLTVVFDPTLGRLGKQSWSLASLFGRPLYSTCPLASISQVYLDLALRQDKLSPFVLFPEPPRLLNVTRGDAQEEYGVYDVKQFLASDGVFDLTTDYTHQMVYRDQELPPLHAHRFVTGFGLERGGIVCQLYNDLHDNLTIVYMETIPWFLQVHFNSIKITSGDKEIKPYKMHYIPGQERAKSYQIELVFRVRPRSVTRVSLNFDRAILKWTEYPPDANHGFYINSAVITTMLPTANQFTALQQNASFFIESLQSSSSRQHFLRIHTETLMVSLPTPDFSMPYNVICLACTVLAIAFGSLHNLTTRAFKVVDPKKAQGLKDKIRQFFRKNKKDPNDAVGTKQETSEPIAGNSPGKEHMKEKEGNS